MSAASSEIVVVDYGMGNLRNVGRAFERAGARPRVTTDPDEILRSDRLVVPGVGALGDAMGALEKLGLVGPLRERIQDGRPYLGICVGLQVLLEEGEEGPARCLGLIPGKVSRFPETSGLPVPHMGWNAVKPLEAHPLLEQGRKCERTGDLAHELLGEGFFHSDLCLEGRRRVVRAPTGRKGLWPNNLRGRYR